MAFLGEGTLLKNGEQSNRTKDVIHYSKYMYMEYQEEKIKQVGVNKFIIDSYPHPDTYASKKRFFEKYCQLPIDSKMPISFICDLMIFQSCHGIKPESYRERIMNFERKI